MSRPSERRTIKRGIGRIHGVEDENLYTTPKFWKLVKEKARRREYETHGKKSLKRKLRRIKKR